MIALVSLSVVGLAPLRHVTHATAGARFVTPRCTFLDRGMPSTPGWPVGRLNDLTNWAVSDTANRPIICEYRPDPIWLWTKWRGTVLSITVVPVLLAMSLGVANDFTAHALSSDTWPLLGVPPASSSYIQQLLGLNAVWDYQLTLCTFILTFFTSQAYGHWRQVYFTTRAIQGRINDICLLLTVAAARDSDATDGVTTYSDEAARLVEQCTRLIRLSHTFFWAATPTCSNGVGDTPYDIDGTSDVRGRSDAIGPVLLSAEGLDGLKNAGELTDAEVEAMLQSELPPSQYSFILLEWVALHATEGLRVGTLRGSPGFEENLLRQVTGLRAEYFNIQDYQAGRMPLAYVQLVQVLVDSLVVLAPLALYSELGSLSIPLTGLLTLFYKGLLELSKSFLDPFGNEGYPGQNIRVDVLVSELNFGAGGRWVKAGRRLPGASPIADV